MKKGLLLALGVTAGLSLSAQAPKVSGVQKADLTMSKTTHIDGDQVNFFAAANAAQRNGNTPTVQTQGTMFSSSFNAFTLLVSASHCLTANQALNAVMFTHRMTPDWPFDANLSPGYIEYSWTTNWGTSWDSSGYADQTNLGNKRFRYPSGAIINPAGNTTVANAINVSVGPYTSGTTWDGFFNNYQNMQNGATSNTNILTHGQPGVVPVSFPRISIKSYDDSSAWVTGGLYLNDDGTTALAQMYRGACLMKAKWDGSAVTWTYDSIKPTFHQDGTGVNDCFTEAMISFSNNGQTGYVVFFGVDASATTSQTRTFSPITYKTTNGGVTWSQINQNFDFTTIPAIANMLIPASDNNLKPWFDQSQGADIVVDNNDQLHVICTISSGASDDDDSLGYTWTLTGQNGATGRHYIYDVHTTANGWDAWLIDSLMTTTSTNNTIFVDGSNSGAAFATDARLQVSKNTAGDHLFYVWVDSDPTALSGENALPDLFGKGVDLTTNMATPRQQFTTTQDFYFHYVSDITLVNGTTYNVGVTNSIDRNGSHDVATTFDHYWFPNCTFTQSQFTVALVGMNEQQSNLGTFELYPNPANEFVNVNLNLVNDGDVTISLTNELGQVVMSENRNFAAGHNTVQLNTANLPAGVYFVTVMNNESKATSKIVLQ